MNMSFTDPPWARDDSTRLKIYWLLVTAAVTRLWIAPLNASLWLDETATYWSACKGFSASLARSQFWPGQNQFYAALLALTIRALGQSEVVLRLPSLLAAIATVWLLFRIGTRLFDKETGTLAALVFVALEEMTRTAPNARPYAITLLLVVGSTLLLLRWLETGRTAYLPAYMLSAAAIIYFHLLFAIIYPVHVIFVLFGSRVGERRVPRRNLIFAAFLLGLLVSPVLWSTVHVKKPSADLSWAGTPDAGLLLTSLMPSVLGAAIFLGLLASLFVPNATARALAGMPARTAVPLVTWLILPPVAAFLVSHYTGFKIFVPRYYLPMFPALALLVGWGIRGLAPPSLRLWLSVCVVLGAMAALVGFHLRFSPLHEDWRAASSVIHRPDITADTPVLIRTGLIETASLRWDTNIDPDSPLLCPLSKYPVPGQVILLPFRLDPASLNYLEHLASNILEPSPRFILFTRRDDEHVKLWLLGRLSDRGFAATDLYQSEWLSVVLFRKSESASPHSHPAPTPPQSPS
jgi:mannosyltransferase